VRSADHKAPHFVVFSSPIILYHKLEVFDMHDIEVVVPIEIRVKF